MIPTLRNLDNLGRILETLKPIRLRLLTSIENEASIPEFLDGVRTALNLEDLAGKYFKKKSPGRFEILSQIKRMVSFSYLNLADDT